MDGHPSAPLWQEPSALTCFKIEDHPYFCSLQTKPFKSVKLIACTNPCIFQMQKKSSRCNLGPLTWGQGAAGWDHCNIQYYFCHQLQDPGTTAIHGGRPDVQKVCIHVRYSVGPWSSVRSSKSAPRDTFSVLLANAISTSQLGSHKSPDIFQITAWASNC